MFFVFPLSSFPMGVTILIFVTISIFAVKLALSVSAPVAPFLSDDAPCESHREQ